MNGKLWHFEIATAIILLLAALIFSAFFGVLFPVLFVIISGVAVYQYYQVSLLERWLRAGGVGKYPAAKGVWEEIYYHLYQIKKREKKRKKRLSTLLKEFRTSTSALPDAAVVLGNNDEIIWSNKAARQNLGLKKADNGQRIPNLIRQPEFIRFLSLHQENSVLTMPSPEDSSILLEFRVVKYGTGLRLMLAYDVTKLKHMERMRKDFVANVSHELRTPLTVLKGYLETLIEFDDGHSPVWSNSFDQMISQTVRMEHLVDDLLMLARLETQNKNTQRISIDRLLTGICEETEGLNGVQNRIELRIDSKDVLYGEERDLRSAFSNLIVNALKYSPDHTTVNVHWYKTTKNFRLDVTDQGDGISAEDIPRVTERFYRVDVNRSRNKGGTGLGLAIVKHVMVRHNAVLQINSEPGKGSCFSCLFPLKQDCRVDNPPVQAEYLNS